jgi:hypothetical protein
MIPSSTARPIVPPGIARRAQKRLAQEIMDDLQIEPLELRARAWHFEMIGAGCDCFRAGAYPCSSCDDEARDLLQLLQSVMDETMAAQRRIIERSDTLPIGRRT